MRAYLEHFPERGGPAKRVEIAKNPFVIGRSPTADLAIYSQKVSKDHALIDQNAGRYSLRDLCSTNGTFANGKRIDKTELDDGDIIHVAHWEFSFCLGAALGVGASSTITQTQRTDTHAKESSIRLTGFLRQLVSQEMVAIVFQSIVDLRTGAIIGFEALGRGSHHQLHQSPAELFQLAEKCEMEGDLCRLFRTQAMKVGADLPARFRLFINLHPSQLTRADCLESLNQLSRRMMVVTRLSSKYPNNRRPASRSCGRSSNDCKIWELSSRTTTSGPGSQGCSRSPNARPIFSSWIGISCNRCKAPRQAGRSCGRC